MTLWLLLNILPHFGCLVEYLYRFYRHSLDTHQKSYEDRDFYRPLYPGDFSTVFWVTGLWLHISTGFLVDGCLFLPFLLPFFRYASEKTLLMNAEQLLRFLGTEQGLALGTDDATKIIRKFEISDLKDKGYMTQDGTFVCVCVFGSILGVCLCAFMCLEAF